MYEMGQGNQEDWPLVVDKVQGKKTKQNHCLFGYDNPKAMKKWVFMQLSQP